ncbi:hypothetical protein PMI38_01367 [Pseudomonas sp. GM84]|uniref:PIN domain-containing protein n=1 Tax=Pseudomonas sp. GM84 TaxID=1144340 RepID=UPI00026FC6F0|nr:PIN domain-containing protein [Pseudomonas sp. GM84]EJN39134.1 hypothetical protein PMI38_01367 [Pseudomonas sp. GM84]
MALNLKVNADVVDISSDTPKPQDVFLVDTNVWYWMTYSRASTAGAKVYQVRSYPTYTNNALAANSTIYQSGVSIAELSHIIEKSEREIFNKANPQVSTKEYRHNFPAERANVCLEIDSACKQVLALGESMNVSIDSNMVKSSLARLKTCSVDGYDLFILEAMAASGVTQVITDDGDFATVPGITVFTANRTIVQAAKAQGKLIVR